MKSIRYSSQNFYESFIFSTCFRKKSSNIIFREIASHGNRDVQCGRTDMPKLMVAFRNFANPSPSWRGHWQVYLLHEVHHLNTTSHLHVYQLIPSSAFTDGSSVCTSRPLQCMAPSPTVFLVLRLIFHDWHKLLENLSVNWRIIIEMELEVVWVSGYASDAAASR